MTEPTPVLRSHVDFPVGHPLHAQPLPAEQRSEILERLERTQRESRDHEHRIAKATNSVEARAIRDVIVEDGNVDWTEFVKHCGGILEVVKLVGKHGDPDTDRIIPLVDELFAKHASQEFQGGVTFTRRPQNRPYVPRSGPSFTERRSQFREDQTGFAEPEQEYTSPLAGRR